MAMREYYVGSTGPFLVDEDDPLLSADNQVAIRSEISNISPSGSVTAQTTFGLSSSVGSSSTYARGDHSHGTPANPVSGVTGNYSTTGAFLLHIVNGLIVDIT